MFCFSAFIEKSMHFFIFGMVYNFWAGIGINL